MDALRIYGIRHHGPGSARSLLNALEADPPEILLIEGPADGQEMLSWVGSPQLKPPIALLIYNPKNLQQTVFFPLAEFSPEWQAILFGHRERIPVRFIDLPMSLAFNREEKGSAPVLHRYDVLSEIARLAGYTDSERWWEMHFERRAYPSVADVFAEILNLMRALREAQPAEDGDTRLREAYMRQEIRRAQREGFHRMAVVCGAWHAPALANPSAFSASADQRLLQACSRLKTQATWIPWSFDRLARECGYAAGVLAPAWYSDLWANTAQLERWFSRAAQLLRSEGLAASPAHIIDAVRITHALAALRGMPLPGIEELREAAITALCEGSSRAYALIERQLVIGDVLGEVPAQVPKVPLMVDFETQVRRARLQLSTRAETMELDLRQAAHERKSRLLHRLCLLDIPWGKELPVTGQKEGGFHERWQLRWSPEYAVQLIEAGQWGGTVEEAAVQRLLGKLPNLRPISDVVRLLTTALRADLVAAIEPLVAQIEALSVEAADAFDLAEAIPPVVDALRYGHARRWNVDSMVQLTDRLLPRVCIQLPDACSGIQYEAARTALPLLHRLQRAVGLLRSETYDALWQEALQHICRQGAPLLAGLSLRLLFDRGWRTAEEADRVIAFRLSPAHPPLEAAQWIEGFLHGGSLPLLYRPPLWHLLNHWIGTLTTEDFELVLPLLRRTFCGLSKEERQKLFALAKRQTQPLGAGELDTPLDAERIALLQPLLKALFK